MVIKKVTMDNRSMILALEIFFGYLERRGRTSILIRAMRSDFDVALNSMNQKKIKQLTKEMGELMRETFTDMERAECEDLMADRLNPDKNVCLESVNVDDILARGKIKNRVEYEVLMDYVDRNIKNTTTLEEIEVANRILSEYSIKK